MCHSFQLPQKHFTPEQACALLGSVCVCVFFVELQPCAMPGLPTTPTSSVSAAFTAMTSILFFQPSTWRVVQLDVLRNLVFEMGRVRSKLMAIGGLGAGQ